MNDLDIAACVVLSFFLFKFVYLAVGVFVWANKWTFADHPLDRKYLATRGKFAETVWRWPLLIWEHK